MHAAQIDANVGDDRKSHDHAYLKTSFPGHSRVSAKCTRSLSVYMYVT